MPENFWIGAYRMDLKDTTKLVIPVKAGITELQATTLIKPKAYIREITSINQTIVGPNK